MFVVGLILLFCGGILLGYMHSLIETFYLIERKKINKIFILVLFWCGILMIFVGYFIILYVLF